MTHPQNRPGGRSARISAAVLAAARELSEEPGVVPSVSLIAERAGVSEVTIYRRWGSVQNVLLEVAVLDTSRRLPVRPTGDLERDLTRWATRAQRSLRSLQGRRLIAAAMEAQLAAPENSSAVFDYVKARTDQIQALLARANPPTSITVADVLDQVLAPLYLRQMFGYAHPGHSAPVLVRNLLARDGNVSPA